MTDNLLYYLGFSHCLGIGPIKFDLLQKYFKTPQKAYSANLNQLSEVIGPQTAEAFIEFRNKFDAEKKAKEIEKKGIKIVTRESKQFPNQLAEIPDTPICLYVKGSIENFKFEKELFIGVVGTRKPTSYGGQITKKLTHELASAGFVIVSGMAIGIDALAHQAALDEGKKTIAVLGCGVDIIYPFANKNLYEEIIRKGGLVVSEFPPGMTVLPGLFIARNRLISGLSSGVLVVEGAKNSGALITARYAAEQGKEVFAPPGPITSDKSWAPNLLLKEGAKLVTSIQDILEEFHMSVTPLEVTKKILQLGKQEEKFFKLLIEEPQLPDEIAKTLSLSVSDVLQVLTDLEMKGIIEKNTEGKYQIKLV